MGPAARISHEQPPAEADPLYLELGGWEGPLDLLLDLARSQKVDLRQVSMRELAHQYVAYITEAQALRLELAADYLIMAAWLAYLKSALLLPKEEQEEPSADELALRLQWRLQRLSAMREAAARLMARDLVGRDVFVRGAPEGLAVARQPEWRCDWLALVRAYAAVRQRQAPVVHRVNRRPIITLEAALERLGRMLGIAVRWIDLREFLPGSDDPRLRRSALASSFAATLELARRGVAEIEQDRVFGPLRIRQRPGG